MKLILASIALIAAQTPAFSSTVTVTFDGPSLSDDGQTVVSQSQGFRYWSSSLYGSGQDLSLHDDFGITHTRIFRPDGRLFTPTSIDVAAFSRIYRTGSTTPPEDDDAFEGWTMAGAALQPIFTFLGFSTANGAVKVSFGPKDLKEGEGQLVFSEKFANISALWIDISFPEGLPTSEDGDIVHTFDPWELSEPDTNWCFEYCAELQVDNLIVDVDLPAPVPLPASALLLGAALLGLGAVRRRQV